MPRSVKCVYCGKEIIRENSSDWLQLPNKRYSHIECNNKKKKELEEKAKRAEYKKKVHEKIKEVCGSDYIKAKVDRQIKKYIEENNINEFDIYKTLVYWYDIRHNDPSQANGGIGIVPYVYREAQKYFKEEEELKKKRNKISKEDIERELKQREAPVEIVSRKIPIQKPKRVNYFMLD